MIWVLTEPKYQPSYNRKEIRIILASQCLNILALNETRLDPSIHNDAIYIRGYDLIRSDRSRTGGGVCLYKAIPKLSKSTRSYQG